MPNFILHAAWTLLVAFILSILYELYRSTAKRDVSRHDTMRGFVSQLFTIYLAAVVVIILLFMGYAWAAWVGLAFCIITILISIFYYNPVIQVERRPGLLDWFEDLVFTGLIFVAAAQLIYALLT
jgi:hypothetical protein